MPKSQSTPAYYKEQAVQSCHVEVISASTEIPKEAHCDGSTFDIKGQTFIPK